MKRQNKTRTMYAGESIGALVYMIEISNIVPNQSQPRAHFDENSIAKLADSIKQHGLLQPLSVRKLSNDGKYELVAGERRLRACKMLGMDQIPCIVISASEESSAELAIIENLIREDLNMFEEAKAFHLLSSQHNLTQEEIAAKMSLSQSAVANKIRLLKFSENEQNAIIKSALTERHARALLRIQDTDKRKEALKHIISSKLNVTESEKYISSLIVAPQSEPKQETDKTFTPDRICSNIYKFISRMQHSCGKNLIINRRSDDKCVVITLTVRKKQAE